MDSLFGFGALDAVCIVNKGTLFVVAWDKDARMAMATRFYK
jgi:hypothetical protein